ncbi:Septum-associated rare lipoprotein A [hydrothermal vent metagenome]|uniref:Septum-associated rare lipoprotein A n=1 Tax=hydrothermal vent metagenome TaxID=652676 RepID=A0A3B1BIZ6_9ZZZZ
MKTKKKPIINFAIASVAVALFFLSGCASKEEIRKKVGVGRKSTPATPGQLKSARPYVVNGVQYYPLADAYGYEKTGIASWYGKQFHGKKTSSGEIYDMDDMTAAHKTLPLQTMVEVTRLDNNKALVLRINDRGPFVGDRIIDLSRGAARKLGIMETGTTRVRVVALVEGKPGPKTGRMEVRSEPIPVEPIPDFNKGVFWVQIGAFSNNQNAERVRERILLPQEMIRLQPVSRGDGMPLVRVQAGPYTDRREAEQATLDLVNQGFGEAFLVRE